MQQLKKTGIIVLMALTVLGTGYLWGARGRWAAEERLAVAERHASLGEARRLVLAGQLALTRLNFGEASGLFEQARVAAEEASRHIQAAGAADAANELPKAVAALTEARALAAKLDQASAGRASDALALLDRTAAALSGP